MAAKVQQKHPEARFVIAGDGPLRTQTEELVKKLQVKNFKILGFRKDIEKVLASFDISVLTSLWEGLPRVFPESMAAGKPIVANNVDGAKEAIKDGINGYILPINTPKRMAKKINYLLDNPKVRKQMGENAQEMVQKFSLEKMLEDLDKLYSKQKIN